MGEIEMLKKTARDYAALAREEILLRFPGTQLNIKRSWDRRYATQQFHSWSDMWVKYRTHISDNYDTMDEFREIFDSAFFS